MTGESCGFLGLVSTKKRIASYPLQADLSYPISANAQNFLNFQSALSESTQNTITVEEYSSKGLLETRVFADGSVSVFNDQGKPARLLDLQGNILMEYAYDGEGRLKSIYLKHARETLPDQVFKSKLGIEEAKVRQLEELAKQKNLAYQTLKDRAQTQKDIIGGQKAILLSQKGMVEKIKARGRSDRNQKADALSQIDAGLEQITQSMTILLKSEAQSYSDLDLQIKSLSDQIESDASIAFIELSKQEEIMKNEILRQEVSPVVYDYYRRILGRDPSSVEYQSWIEKLDYANPGKTKAGIDLTKSLTDFIQALPELTQRQTYVSNIKSKVKNKIQSFLSSSQEGKLSQAQSLGLAQNDLITLSSADAQKILTWLDSRSLHFGQSAFLSLESLLDQKGISYAREDIAERAIFIDILTGVISPLDDGDLVLSVFALNKVAQSYGLNLSGANLSWEDLLTLYRSTPTARVVAHVNGNHFVVIHSMTETSVTYMDPGRGEDKKNEVITLSKKDFLKGFKGNVSLETSVLISSSILNPQSKILSASQTQKIRGAFFFFFIPAIIGAFASIGGAIASVIAGIGAILGSIGSLVGTILSSIGQVLGGIGGILQGFGASVFQGIHMAASSLFGALGNVGSLLSQNIFGSLIKASFGQTLFQQAVRTGLSFATSKGLEALGVNPAIANIASAFVTGGFQGLTGTLSPAQIAAGMTRSTLVMSNIFQAVAIEGIGQMGTKLGLNPSLTNILSLSTAAMGGQLIDGTASTLSQAFSNIKPQLFSSLAQYGVEKLGASLGLDSRLTGLIGTPISAGISAGFTGGTDVGNNIISAINNGLIRGATSLGIEYLTDKAHLDPLLGALTTRAITGAIEGALGGGNVSQKIFHGFTCSALNIARLGVSGTDPWSQAQYLQRVLSISDIIRQKGLAQALEDTITQVMTEDSISSILQSFNTVGAFIQDHISNNKTKVVVKDGKNYNRIQLSSGDWVDLDEGKLNIDELKIGNQTERGTFGVDAYGNFGLLSGYKTGQLDNNNTTYYEIKNGNATNITAYDSKGNIAFEITPGTSKDFIGYNSQGQLQDAVLQTHQNTSTYLEITQGQISDFSFYQPMDPFEFILNPEQRDGFGFRLAKTQDGSYQVQESFSQSFIEIFQKGLSIDPFISANFEQALHLVLPVHITQGIAQATNLISSFKNRYNLLKSDGFGYTDSEAMAWALHGTAGDLLGYTPLMEGIFGVDSQTGRLLSTADRSLKIGLGVLSLAGTAIGGAELLHSSNFLPTVNSSIQNMTTTLRGINTQLGAAGSVNLGSKIQFRNGLPQGVSSITDSELIRLGRVPFGFESASEYTQFTNQLKSGLANAGAPNAKPIFQGSSTTGIRFKSRLPFDDPNLPRSDFDIAIADKGLFDKAKSLDIQIWGKTRTMPLDKDATTQIEKLGLTTLRAQLSQQVGRDVNFMIFESVEEALKKGPSIRVE